MTFLERTTQYLIMNGLFVILCALGQKFGITSPFTLRWSFTTTSILFVGSTIFLAGCVYITVDRKKQ